MAIGSWKKNPIKRGRYIRRGLSTTLAPPGDIANRVGGSTTAKGVSGINRRERIRPRELVLQIAESEQAKIRAETEGKRGRKKQRPKLAIFSKDEKNRLLQRYKGTISSMAAGWWKSDAVKLRFGGNWKEFLKAINEFLFEQLDYFRSDVVGKNGKPKQPLGWIIGGTNLFCKRCFFETVRSKAKESVIRKGGEQVTARGWVPLVAKPLLKKLGLNIEKIKDISGFWDIRAQIIKISREEETGLTKGEKQVVAMRLDDKTMQEIAWRVGLRSRSRIHAVETAAVKKIKKRLAQIAGTD